MAGTQWEERQAYLARARRVSGLRNLLDERARARVALGLPPVVRAAGEVA